MIKKNKHGKWSPHRRRNKAKKPDRRQCTCPPEGVSAACPLARHRQQAETFLKAGIATS